MIQGIMFGLSGLGIILLGISILRQGKEIDRLKKIKFKGGIKL